MKQYSLYIDHQQLAPLIHSLEDTIQVTNKQHSYRYRENEVRLPIYEQFILIVKSLYSDRFGSLKLQEDEVKLQEAFQGAELRKDIEVKEGKCSIFDREEVNRMEFEREQRVRTRAGRNLQIEIKLVQWMIGCDKTLFDKREISDKYGQICRDGKKKFSLAKIMKVLQKYRLKNIIVRDKNGEEHFLRADPNLSTSMAVKREQFSREMSRIMNNESIVENGQAWGYFEDRENEKDISGSGCLFPVLSELTGEQSGNEVGRSTLLVQI